LDQFANSIGGFKRVNFTEEEIWGEISN
jgi:hypothetical protein